MSDFDGDGSAGVALDPNGLRGRHNAVPSGAWRRGCRARATRGAGRRARAIGGATHSGGRRACTARRTRAGGPGRSAGARCRATTKSTSDAACATRAAVETENDGRSAPPPPTGAESAEPAGRSDAEEERRHQASAAAAAAAHPPAPGVTLSPPVAAPAVASPTPATPATPATPGTPAAPGRTSSGRHCNYGRRTGRR